jgi:hypothetical protein
MPPNKPESLLQMDILIRCGHLSEKITIIGKIVDIYMKAFW